LLLLNFTDGSYLSHQNILPQSISEVGAMLLVSIAMLLYFAMTSYYGIEKNHQFKSGDLKERPVRNRLVVFFSGIARVLSFLVMILLPMNVSFSAGEVRFIEISIGCLFLELLFFISDWSKFVVPEGKIVLRHTDNKLLYPGEVYSIWPWAPDAYTPISLHIPIAVNDIFISLKDRYSITGFTMHMFINKDQIPITKQGSRLYLTAQNAEKINKMAEDFIKNHLLQLDNQLTPKEFMAQAVENINKSMKNGWIVPFTYLAPSFVFQPHY
jgi:hypothetical protein